ncbi:MAG: hypothetical protein ABR599_00890 [Gemmatimonadota bacterium]
MALDERTLEAGEGGGLGEDSRGDGDLADVGSVAACPIVRALVSSSRRARAIATENRRTPAAWAVM